MSISKLLKKASIKKSGFTRQAIEQRAKKIKEDYGPLSDDVTFGIIAHHYSVDITKIISDEKLLSEIREQLDRITIFENEQLPLKTKIVTKIKTVKIGETLSLSDPILKPKIINEAKQMTSFYAELYVFENSVREVILRVLNKKIGKDWWKSVNGKIRGNVAKRIKKEKENAWHGGRGEHEIYYTNIGDLVTIINAKWDHFKDIFPNERWVRGRIEEIELSRNILDHHNPVSKRDQNRARGYFKDWNDQIASKKNLLK